MTGMPEHASQVQHFGRIAAMGHMATSHNRQKAKYYAGHSNSLGSSHPVCALGEDLRFAHVLWHGSGKGTLARISYIIIYKVVDAYKVYTLLVIQA